MTKRTRRRITKPAHRGRLCGAQRGSNVTPLTTLDRHTGRAALGASASVSIGAALPAGSREVEWRSPLDIEGGGGGSSGSDRPAPVDGDAAPILSSYLGNNCPEPQKPPPRSRRGLLHRVERRTQTFRLRRAGEARRKATEARRRCQPFREKWYLARAKGQLERFDQVRECGGKDVVQSCGECGHEARRITSWCRHWRLCVGCRSRRGIVYRKRFRASREHALRRLSFLMNRVSGACKLSEKLLTLTLAHSGDVAHDLHTLPRAWRWFWRLLREQLERDGMAKEIVRQLVYVRVIEATRGTKHDGHAHMHVYLIAPYIHHEVLGLLWARALRRCGCDVNANCDPTPLAEVLGQEMPEWRRNQLRQRLVTRKNGAPLEFVPNPVVDIQECYGGVENELIKYLVKDAERDEHGNLLFDDVFLARVYEGTEGIRMVQTSRRFWIDHGKRTCRCEKCGSQQLRRKIEKAKPADDAGPIWSAMNLPPERWRGE